MKGMQKIKRGTGFGGLLNYALEEGKGKLLNGNMAGRNELELRKEFDSVRKLRPDIEKPVWHNSLRLPVSEKISDEQWETIAADYMQEMGFSKLHQYALIQHDDKDGQHVHIAANRIAVDGSIYLGKNENLKSTRVIANLEKKYGLQITKGVNLDQDGNVVMPEKRQLKKGEIEMALRTEVEPPKQRLQKLLDAAMQDKPTVVQFAERLAAAGVEVRASVASTSKMNGFSFSLDGASFKASDLGDKYKWSKLQKEVSYEQARDSESIKRFSAAARSSADASAATESDRAVAAPLADQENGADAVRATERASASVEAAREQNEQHSIDDARRHSSEARAASTGASELERRDTRRTEQSARNDTDAARDSKAADRRATEAAAATNATATAASAAASSSTAQRSKQKDFDSRSSNSNSSGAFERVLDIAATAKRSADSGTSDSAVAEATAAHITAKVNAWRQQHEALDAPAYRVTLKSRRDELGTRNFSNERNKLDDEVFYSAADVEKAIPRLSRENARGYDIYITPIDSAFHYVVIDDVTKNKLNELKAAGYTANLIQESSTDNHQAIIKIARNQTNDDKHEQSLANKLVMQLNKQYGDPKFSGVVHPFRMAGFANKKEGRENAFTKIVRISKTLCDTAFRALAAFRDEFVAQVENERKKEISGALTNARALSKLRTEQMQRAQATIDKLKAEQGTPAASAFFTQETRKFKAFAKSKGWTVDLSKIDYRVAVEMLKNGYEVSEIKDAILSSSENLAQRHKNTSDYALRTAQSALASKDYAEFYEQRQQRKNDDNSSSIDMGMGF